MSCTAYTCSLEFFESLVNDLLKIILTLEQVFGGAAKILLGTHVFHRGVPRFEFQLYFQSPSAPWDATDNYASVEIPVT